MRVLEGQPARQVGGEGARGLRIGPERRGAVKRLDGFHVSSCAVFLPFAVWQFFGREEAKLLVEREAVASDRS